jgi:GNAT superfamily N-acetyltransferase
VTPEALYRVMEATWPPAATFLAGPFCLRDGQGGGKRVSAATAEGPWAEGDIARAEEGMAALGQEPLFQVRAGEAALDTALAARGYRIVDPVVGYAAPVAAFAPPPDPMTAFAHWPPLAVAARIWAEAGIGPERIAVMARAQGPHTVVLGRTADRAAGVAFVACAGEIAMLHALEVPEALRRQGTAHRILRAAAHWAQEAGVSTLSLVVTEANAGARSLYASFGMQAVGHYHYRTK